MIVTSSFSQPNPSLFIYPGTWNGGDKVFFSGPENGTWDHSSLSLPQELEDLLDCNCNRQLLRAHLPVGHQSSVWICLFWIFLSFFVFWPAGMTNKQPSALTCPFLRFCIFCHVVYFVLFVFFGFHFMWGKKLSDHL